MEIKGVEAMGVIVTRLILVFVPWQYAKHKCIYIQFVCHCMVCCRRQLLSKHSVLFHILPLN